ncbi:WecB/TagA/CpsF family glycosyltransferase [Bacillus sp. 1P02SD]|uniref:WecB/TagA/CpsF family glycosyltransferase n=1 Tax=Bacillus sp. 1P02SD TaxID=3132264 RepID=UPI0039A16B86
MRKVEMFNIEFDNIDFDGLFSFFEDAIVNEKKTYLVTCNVDHIMNVQKDSKFREIYNNADLIVADGVPVVWASKLLGNPLKEKISGSDIIPKLANKLVEKNYSLFFLGADEGVAAKAAENLKENYPKIKVVGTYSPSYGFEKNEGEIKRIIEMINNSKPDLLFVGVGSPKQEKWIYKYYQDLQVPVSIGVGATFDFLAGNVKRAPLFMQKSGLEWFWRLIQEPKRLWKRYLVNDSKFIILFINELIKKMFK